MTSEEDGSLTADGTEQQIGTTITAAGTFVLLLDTVNMAVGDIITLKIQTKVRSTGTIRDAYVVSYGGAQNLAVKLSVPVPSPNEIKFFLTQTDGTNRAYPWEIVSL